MIYVYINVELCWMPDMRFCSLWFFFDTTHSLFYIDVSVIEFLMDCKAHTLNSLFPSWVTGCIVLDEFEYAVWVMELFYRPCMISMACPRIHVAMSHGRPWVLDLGHNIYHMVLKYFFMQQWC